jgi:gamma-glutamyl:cysteine ligase YbdK (ATP-grasp superfamily)
VTGEPLGLFQGIGIELEYMIVRKDDLSVYPASDRILRHFSGDTASEIEMGELNWSNELVLHVLELKTNGPAASLESLPGRFQTDVRRINGFLEAIGGRLLPTGMHPWMDPLKETRLWPHAYNEVYESYNRIFGCQGHGWSNLQSVHVNLPFANDDEFGRLHAAVRLVLPILPALAASSPIVEGRSTGILDNRLEFYRNNQAKIPSLTGDVIPEPFYTESEYRTALLDRLFRDMAPYDTEGCLREEWINSRGAIARFERNTIEIRLLDAQECPLADCTVAATAVAMIRFFIAETTVDYETQKRFPTDALARLLLETIRDAERADLRNANFLRLFDMDPAKASTAGELWRLWAERFSGAFLHEDWSDPLSVLLEKGTLASRLLRALGADFSRERIAGVYRSLAESLADGRLFLA